MKSPLTYPGGKSKALKHILPVIPAKFTEYREPFLGGASVYLGLRQEKRMLKSWVNDLNTDIFYFWCTVRDKLPALVSKVQKYYDEYKNGDGKLLYDYLKAGSFNTKFERAARFFVLNRITFSGLGDAGGFSKERFDKRFTQSSIDNLAALKGGFYITKITGLNYAELLLAKGKDVFIYLDPPYLSNKKSRLYGNRGTLHVDFNHAELAEQLKTCNHRWLLSYDNTPEILNLYSFANITLIDLQYGMNNVYKEVAPIGKELLIRNY